MKRIGQKGKGKGGEKGREGRSKEENGREGVEKEREGRENDRERMKLTCDQFKSEMRFV